MRKVIFMECFLCIVRMCKYRASKNTQKAMSVYTITISMVQFKINISYETCFLSMFIINIKRHLIVSMKIFS